MSDMQLSEQEMERRKHLPEAARRALEEADARRAEQDARQAELDAARADEVNGPKGAEPTRYTDWERKGIAYDF